MSPWEVLGIAPTAEAGAIRKAYAARLKQTRPEDDPAGFARLRAAYEAALQMAPRIAPPQRPPLPEAKPPEPKPETPAAAPPPAEAPKLAPIPPPLLRPPMPEPPKLMPIRPADRAPDPARRDQTADMALLELPPAGQEATRNIVDALNRKANFEAARLLYAACEGNLLPLRTEFQLKDRLALALSADEELRTAQLQEIASRFGWYSGMVTPSTQANSPQARLAARLDRELAAERAEKAAAEAEAKPAPRPQPVKRGGGIGYGWIGFLLFVFLSAIGSLSNHAPQSVPSQPDCRGGFSSMPIDALKRCADAGVSSAQDYLGAIYYQGVKLPQDFEQAVSLFRAAADRGSVDARRNLAYMEHEGLGTPRDLAGARQLYLAGAQQGDVLAENLIGYMMLTGEGGPPDAAHGFGWVKQAAISLNIEAMTGLGSLYASGSGTPRSPIKAAAWRKVAAEAGNPRAMYEYGNMLLGGAGVPDDLPEAYRWLSLAAAQKNDNIVAADAQISLTNPLLLQVAGPLRAMIDAMLPGWKPGRPIPPPLSEQ
jgi:TPR repeat protein